MYGLGYSVPRLLPTLFRSARGRKSTGSLGMTKGTGRFHLYLMLDEATAGPSTSLRSGRDDNFFEIDDFGGLTDPTRALKATS
jgi:hypothetical protein